MINIDGYKPPNSTRTTTTTTTTTRRTTSNGNSSRADARLDSGKGSSGFASIRMGKWKILHGFPGSPDTWVALPNSSTSSDDIYREMSDDEALASPWLTGEASLFGHADQPCSQSPCLFDVIG